MISFETGSGTQRCVAAIRWHVFLMVPGMKSVAFAALTLVSHVHRFKMSEVHNNALFVGCLCHAVCVAYFSGCWLASIFGSAGEIDCHGDPSSC